MKRIDEKECDRDNAAVEWCLLLAEGSLDEVSRDAFERWINVSANKCAFDEALRVWRACDQAADLPEVVRLRRRGLEQFQRAQGRRWRDRIPVQRLWAVAAVFIGALILGVSLFHTPTQVYRTGVGERQIAMLADGSRLSLDADTEVRVRLAGNRRELALARGRAKFDVARDPLRPFTVKVADKMVVATGTSFSVELLNREARVLLYEGHVAVVDAARSGSKPLQADARNSAANAYTALEPGKALVTRLDQPSAAPQVTAIESAQSLSWEAGQLNFEDEPLVSALERINRYSVRKVRLSDPRLGRLTVNGVFEAGDIDAFVEAMEVFNHLRAVDGDDEVTLRPS